jgi:hypothetical protein
LPKNKNKTNGLEVALNSGIAVSGVILLGFLYSFSQNQLHDGIEIEPSILLSIQFLQKIYTFKTQLKISKSKF